MPLVVFAGWIVLAAVASSGRARWRTVFFAYGITATLLVALTGRDLWPFAAWRFASYAVTETGSFLEVRGVDRDGREHPLDWRAFEPLEGPEILAWVAFQLRDAPPERRAALLDYVRDRANRGLAQARAGQRVGTFARILGPLTAPLFHLQSTDWSRDRGLPESFDAVRFRNIHWRVIDGRLVIERRDLFAETAR